MKTFGPKLFMLSLIITCVCCTMSTSQSVFLENKTMRTQDSLKSSVSDADTILKDSIFSFVEEMPEFPGGTEGMMKFLSTNLIIKHDDNCFNGRVVMTFVVSKSGKLVNPKIIRSACPDIDKQVMKVVKSFPDWKPGKHHGKPVNVHFTFPIHIDFKE
jgi:hypothetical protein